MSLSKVSSAGIITVAVVIFSEFVYQFTKLWWNRKQEAKKTHRNDRIFHKVIFFPDKGILLSQARVPLNYNYDKMKSSSSTDHNENLVITKPRCVDSNNVLHGWSRMSNTTMKTESTISSTITKTKSTLSRSTSLIHLLNCIKEAQTSVDVCVLVFTETTLMEELLRAKKRGVRVRVIIDKQMADVDGSQIPKLRSVNIPVLYGDPAIMMHHKFALLDCRYNHMYNDTTHDEQYRYCKYNEFFKKWGVLSGNRDKELARTTGKMKRVDSECCKIGVLMCGSFNWTWGAVVNNRENVLITNNPEIVLPYAQEFDALWDYFHNMIH